MKAALKITIVSTILLVVVVGVVACNKHHSSLFLPGPLCLQCEECTDSIEIHPDIVQVKHIYPQKRFVELSQTENGLWYIASWQDVDSLFFFDFDQMDVSRKFPVSKEVVSLELGTEEAVLSYADWTFSSIDLNDGHEVNSGLVGMTYVSKDSQSGFHACLAYVDGERVNLILDENLMPYDTLYWDAMEGVKFNRFTFSEWTGEGQLSFIGMDMTQADTPIDVYVYRVADRSLTQVEVDDNGTPGGWRSPKIIHFGEVPHLLFGVRGNALVRYDFLNHSHDTLARTCESVRISELSATRNKLALCIYYNKRIDYVNMTSSSEILLYDLASQTVKELQLP